ncbi:MAG: formylglycine-generating enzyme family protein [Cyanobacteria bacterium J06639_14]
MGNCYAQRKVIILDCCFGAAFADGFLTMDSGGVDVEAQLGGEGWVVLTAATARNYALEQEGEPLSVYTRYLVEGLKTGAAAPEGSDQVSVGHLHEYVRSKVQTAAPTMNPTIFNAQQGYTIAIARVVIGNPELQFRKAAERYTDIEVADVSVVGKRYLKTLAIRLGIAPQRAQTITHEVLRPHRERRDSLQEYEVTYREAIEHYGALPERPRRELQDLQRLLNLRDEDVSQIHARIPAPPPKPIPSPKPPPTSQPQPQSPPQASPTPRRTPSPSPPSTRRTTPSAPSRGKLSRKQFLVRAGLAGGGLVTAISIPAILSSLAEPDFPEPVINFANIPPAPEGKTLESATFEVVTVDTVGNIINRRSTQAQFFTEGLGEGVVQQGVKPLDMVAIPGGEFTMGSRKSEKDRNNNEGPRHRVIVPSFFLGKYAVTQAQFQAVIGQNPSQFSENGANRPVETVSWEEAEAFCKTLSERTGRTYRLPSEAEWEYACRAGTETPFSFGPTITTDLANYNGSFTYSDELEGSYRAQTIEVGQFPPNGFGLYDLHGNVWEWCQDVWHPNYDGAPTNGTAWMQGEDQDRRVLRGGSWNNFPRNCRSANRDGNARDFWNDNLGFRVVCASP